MGAIDYWCNGFLPRYEALWDAAIGDQDLSIKIRRNPDDAFTTPAEMVSRMDEIGFSTLLLPTAEVPASATEFAYERYATSPEDARKLSAEFPGRFAALHSIDPTEGARGLAQAAAALVEPHFVGLQLHTHSWDRPFDDRDYYPYYALAAEQDVPVVMQAGASGGPMPSECGKPIGIDRPAIYFARVRFVLSHTGWPWVDEAISMAQKHANVFLGTAAWPPHRWPQSLVEFIRGAGRAKVLLGTSFPTVGHRHLMKRLAELDLESATQHGIAESNALRIFSRLAEIGSF